MRFEDYEGNGYMHKCGVVPHLVLIVCFVSIEKSGQTKRSVQLTPVDFRCCRTYLGVVSPTCCRKLSQVLV